MRVLDNDALICDFAQYYRIYDYMSLPVQTVAVLACGLPDDSRIKRKVSGNRGGTDTLLLAAILDGIRTLVWMNTKDAHEGRNRPESVFSAFTGENREPDGVGFDSGEDFMEYRRKFTG